MKNILINPFLTLAFLLSACTSLTPSTSTQAAAQAETASTSTKTAALSTSYPNALPIAAQLLLGTFKLEGTGQSLTASQAARLVPLWQNYLTLIQSLGPGLGQSTSTQNSKTIQSQIDDVVDQIEAAMTPAQVQAISAMKISEASAQTILNDQGISMAGPGQNSAGAPPGMPPAGGGQSQGNPSTGGQPQRTPSPGAGQPQGAPPAGLSSNSSQPSGNQPSSQPQPGNAYQIGLLPPQVTVALIQLLQKTAGEPNSTSLAVNSLANAGPANPGNNSVSPTSKTIIAAYTLNGGSASQDSQSYSASNQDESAVYVTNAGQLTLSRATITTSGTTSSHDNSSFHGLNAAVLAVDGSTISLSDSSVTTTGTGANGAFATNSGSSIDLSNVTIQSSADGAHGVMATAGGSLILTDVNITTAGGSASAIATDRGGGTITVTGGTVKTSGSNSAGIYSTGKIMVTNGTFLSTGAEAVVIEGANSITLSNTSLSSTKAGKWGVMIYQSMSGDAQGTQGIFTMTGGSLTYSGSDGPLFYVTNSAGVIVLKGVSLQAASGTLVKAASGNWGTSGSNGGTVVLTADGQTLNGNLVADAFSSITLILQNGSELNGAINTEKTAKAANLTMDATSTWTVTADSYLSSLSDASGISGTTITNITGNGHTVYYDASLATNNQLGGKNYSLSGGGTLKPLQ
jgi:hypothetical protein